MAIALVTSSVAENKALSTTLALALGASTSTGDLLVAMFFCYGQTPPIVGAGTFSDNRGNTWTRHADYIDADYNRGAIYTAIAKDSGTVTVTAVVGATAYLTMVVAAFSGVANNTANDTVSAYVTSGAPSTDVHHGDLTLSAAGILLGHCSSMASGAGTLTQDGDWTLLAEREADYYNHSGCYRITTGSGTYNDGWTLQNAKRWGAIGVSFLAATSGGLSIPLVQSIYRRRRS